MRRLPDLLFVVGFFATLLYWVWAGDGRLFLTLLILLAAIALFETVAEEEEKAKK